MLGAQVDLAIAGAIVGLVRTLGLRVVAEGVKQKKQPSAA